MTHLVDVDESQIGIVQQRRGPQRFHRRER
jgi:hypothetical protein